LLGADEVFLTNVIMQVLPITKIEKHTVGDGKVGPMVKKLQSYFAVIFEDQCRKTK
jgi:branched-subunit amino acid aminotransferase/4-amino-4-deoxychorismate lyase